MGENINSSKYSEKYKKNAVKEALEHGVSECASRLGIKKPTLYTWLGNRRYNPNIPMDKSVVPLWLLVNVVCKKGGMRKGEFLSNFVKYNGIGNGQPEPAFNRIINGEGGGFTEAWTFCSEKINREAAGLILHSAKQINLLYELTRGSDDSDMSESGEIADVIDDEVSKAYKDRNDLTTIKRFIVLLKECTSDSRRGKEYQWQDDEIKKAVISGNIGEIEKAWPDIFKEKNGQSPEAEIDPQALAIQHFEAVMKSGRYKSYFAVKNDNAVLSSITDMLETGKEKEGLSLYDILFSDENDCVHSLNLCGRGGSGKTFQILGTIDRILKENTGKIPFYIPLNEMYEIMEGNLIYNYLVSRVSFPDKADLERTLHDLGENIIIFADGLNEITSADLRQRIVSDISFIRSKFKTRFCISSRSEHTGLFLTHSHEQSFGRAFVKELNDEQIVEYFEKVKCGIVFNSLHFQTKKLLRTPQGLSMYCDLCRNDINCIDIDSLGELINKYALMIIGGDWRKYTAEIHLLTIVAYNMTIDETFRYSYNQIEKVIGTGGTGSVINESPLSVIFTSDRENYYQFTHQNFRDCFAAIRFSELVSGAAKNIKSLSGIFRRNNITTNDEILELVASFLTEETIQQTIDAIREYREEDIFPSVFRDNYDFPLSVLIRIWSFSHGNSIAGLDLCDLDLRQVSLNNYQLNSDECTISLSGCRIGLDTFLKPGLPTGSSAVCRYEVKQPSGGTKTYIAAFARENVLKYDVEENQTSMIYGTENYGWVNCCCTAEIGGRKYVYLGCERNAVMRFDTGTERKELFVKTRRKTARGIMSIAAVTRGGRKYIVFSDYDGMIFVIDAVTKKMRSISCPCEEERTEGCFISAYDNKIYIGCGKHIYVMWSDEKETDEIEIKEYTTDRPFLRPIKDICITSKFIFLNQRDRITVISKREHSLAWEYLIKGATQTDNYVMYAGGNKPDNFFFTRLSYVPKGYYRSFEGVLVGVKTVDEKLYKELPEFFEIMVKRSGGKILPRFTEIRSEQRLATHTGVYFRNGFGGTDSVRIATTSDDRSVDIIAPHNEEIAPIHIEGAYNGVHYIDFIDKDNMICAQYDGSVIHLHNIDDKWKWKVSHVRKIHSDWCWKALCYSCDEHKTEIVSCSYDQTLRLTDMMSYSQSQVLCTSKEKMLDFYITYDKKRIFSVSETEVHEVERRDGDWISKSKDLSEMKSGISVRCIVDLGNDRPYFFYNTGLNTAGFIAYINQDSIENMIECEQGVFIRKMVFDKETKRLTIAGNRRMRDIKNLPYIAFYSFESRSNRAELTGSCEVDNGPIYIGSAVPNQDRTITLGDSIISMTVDDSINDIVYLSSEKLLAVCKSGRIWLVKINSGQDNAPFGSECEFKILKECSPQPMTISFCENRIMIGLLDGKILQMKLSDDDEVLEYGCYVHTQATLLSTEETDLQDCDFREDEKSRLSEPFAAYFSFDE